MRTTNFIFKIFIACIKTAVCYIKNKYLV